MQRFIFIIIYDFYFRVGYSGIGEIEIGKFIEFEESNLLLALLVDAIMCSDGEQPGRKGPLWVVPFEILISSPECLLRCVLRGGGLSKHPVTQVENRSLVGSYQHGEGFIISMAGFVDPLWVYLRHCCPAIMFILANIRIEME